MRSGRCNRNMRLDTPLSELTKEDTNDLRRVWDKQVDMIVCAIDLDQSRFKVSAYHGEYSPKTCNGFAIEYVIAVFGQEDQMYVSRFAWPVRLINLVVAFKKTNLGCSR
jgi:hypothetical protein